MRAAASVIVIAAAAAGCGRYGFEGDDGADDTTEARTLTITVKAEGGAGTVLGPDGIECTTTCEYELPLGETLTLRGAAETGSWLAGWDSAVCGGNFDCVLDLPDGYDEDLEITAVFRPRPNRVFISSTSFDGSFGGPEVADAECALRAASAGLDGDWLAYLSTSTRKAFDLLVGSRGWIRMDGAPVADFPAQFTEGPLVFAPWLDESGTPLPHDGVYLGTIGPDVGDTCNDWTNNTPDVAGTATSTDFGTNTLYGWGHGCDSALHFLCVETGKDVEVAPFPDTGKLAFVTTQDWQPMVGTRDSADALCQSEAEAAGREGAFLAALSTTTESIASRFIPGTIWTRVDGVRLMRDGTAMTTDFLDVAPELTLLGAVVFDDYWTGTLRFDQPSQLSENCSDWTTGKGTDGTMHWTSKVDVSQPQKFDDCSSAVPVLCLEQ
jgi:hypothetical protein